ncbi:hypothetical protein B9Q16_24105 [Pantoea ananatis]|nr:hypothetical protein B9Q16_24105 [Pantoea ananatis]
MKKSKRESERIVFKISPNIKSGKHNESGRHRYRIVECNRTIAQPSPAQHSTAQHSPAQHSTAQHNGKLYKTL